MPKPKLVIGSKEHKELLCRMFIDTFTPFEPKDLPWPDLDDAARARLAALPIWDMAVQTEADTALKVQTLGQVETDPLMKEAITMQGYEEGRHAEMLKLLVNRYGIKISDFDDPAAPPKPDWAFMRVGYGECFDSFFAFGLYRLAKESGFFPPALCGIFDPIMQEEGRHILFHVNWVAFNQAQMPYASRPQYVFKRGLAMWLQIVSRAKTAMSIKGGSDHDQDNFAMTAHSSFGDFSATDFLRICLEENEKRLAPYDERLLRPTLVPSLAKAFLKLAPKPRAAVAA